MLKEKNRLLPNPRKHNLSGNKVSMDARPESTGEGRKSCQRQKTLSFPPQMSVPTDH